MTLHEEQLAACSEAQFKYARENPDQIYAQVSVGGKAVATVCQSGMTSLETEAFGADLTEHGDLACSRMGAGEASTVPEPAAASGTGA